MLLTELQVDSFLMKTLPNSLLSGCRSLTESSKNRWMHWLTLKGCATTYPSFLSRQVWWNCFLKWSNKSNVWFSFHFQPLRHCCSCTKVFIISRGRHWPDLGAFPMEVSFPVEESHTLVLTESWLLIVVPELRSGFNFPRPSSKEESPSSLLSSRSDDCAHISTLTLSKS